VQTIVIPAADLLARLADHRLLGKAPRQEHEWLMAHGVVRRFEPGGPPVLGKGDPVDFFYVLLRGRFSFFVDGGTGHRKVTEWRSGDLMGVMPHSRLVYSPGEAITDEEAEMLAIPRALLHEMTVQCPFVTTACVHAMLDRARLFNASALQDEKMISLGRLSAGLAHELNNPASAAARSARTLGEAVMQLEVASRRLGALGLSDAQYGAIDAIRNACLVAEAPLSRSALERADREDEITDWLERHNADVDCSLPLAETAVTLDALDKLAAAVAGLELDVVLNWIAAGCTARTLSRDVERSAARIHDLVSAVKRFTHLDQPLVQEPLALEQGIRDTVTMLGAKARDKSASVTLTVEPGTPRARASAEINQVWTNLIDNALDAVDRDGRVEIRVGSEQPWVVVRVTDNGRGIPSGISARVFDPFFTTKAVGQGTGLGLDIARRILRQWNSEIEFTSEPGRTEFTVRLPAENGEGS
jgi:signal transduction histidine kinase